MIKPLRNMKRLYYLISYSKEEKLRPKSPFRGQGPYYLRHRFSDVCGTLYYLDATFTQYFHFSSGGIISPANNGSSVPHPSTSRGGLTSNKTYNRFFISIGFDPSCCFCFHAPTNFTYHY